MAWSSSLVTNAYLTGQKPVPTPADASVVAVRFALDLGTTDLQANDIGPIGILPAGYEPLDVYVDYTDIDSSTAAVVFQVGILNAAADTSFSTDASDGGGHWGATTAANTAQYQRITPNGNAIPNVRAESADRLIGLRVATAPTTAVAGTVGITVLYHSAF